MPESILELNRNTINKIMERLDVGCSNCGWKLATCDIHHIVHRSKGGTNEHSNLANLCPNCHRLAHHSKIDNFVTLEEQLSEKWKTAYRAVPRSKVIKKPKKEGIFNTKNIENHNLKKIMIADKRALQVLPLLKESNIDFTKFGWVKKAAEIIGIAPNKVNQWLKKHDPEFLESCFMRS